MSSTRHSHESHSSSPRTSRSTSAPARSRSHHRKRRRRRHHRRRSHSRPRRSRSYRHRSRSRSRRYRSRSRSKSHSRKRRRSRSRSHRRRSSKRKRRRRNENTTILVMGVFGFRKSKIRSFFSEEYGPCSVWIEDEQGYAFVDFRHNRDAEEALECTHIDGRKVSCRWNVGKGLVERVGQRQKDFLHFPNGRDSQPLPSLLLNSSSSEESDAKERSRSRRKTVIKPRPPDTEKLKDVAASIAEKIANLRAEKKVS